MTVPHYSVYSSSKRALLGFSLTARAELEKDRIAVSEIYPFITATNFGNNRMGNPAGGGPSSNYGEADKPEFVASLILQGSKEGRPSISRTIVFAKWPGSPPSMHSDLLLYRPANPGGVHFSGIELRQSRRK